MTQQRNVLTIATGKRLYFDLAINLARSFYWWHKDNAINFILLTDLPDHLPDDLNEKISVMKVLPDELGKGFSPKLHMDKFAPCGQTLFIDSDCLIYGSLDDVFSKFKGHHVSVTGTYISEGEWFGDITAICKSFNVAHLPKFNGGLYYIERGGKSSLIFKKARELETIYDEIGFKRLRGRPNDEVLIALSMELYGETIIPEDGNILGEFVNFQSGITSDLLNGLAELYNDPLNPLYQKNWPLTVGRPLIVHFLGHHNQTMPYIKEVRQLKLVFEKRASVRTAKLLTTLQVTLLSETGSWLKQTLRPLFRLLFGVRKVKKSDRVID